MSWPTGVCSSCGGIYDYRWSWGYEKPDGLDEVNGKLMCSSCRNEYNRQVKGNKHEDPRDKKTGRT